jgi:hypothetical protein
MTAVGVAAVTPFEVVYLSEDEVRPFIVEVFGLEWFRLLLGRSFCRIRQLGGCWLVWLRHN